MDDYKGIFAQEYLEEIGRPSRSSHSKGTYSIKVVHRGTMQVVWEGTVEATSKKGAQAQWRKEYSDVRSRYDHSYGLAIKRI